MVGNALPLFKDTYVKIAKWISTRMATVSKIYKIIQHTMNGLLERERLESYSLMASQELIEKLFSNAHYLSSLCPFSLIKCNGAWAQFFGMFFSQVLHSFPCQQIILATHFFYQQVIVKIHH